MNPSPPDLKKLLVSARVKQVPAGQILLYEGDLPREAYILKSGVIKLYDIDEQGNEKILHIVRPPALVPFSFYAGQTKPLRWFYAAIVDCSVYVVDAVAFQEAIYNNAVIAKSLVNEFSEDVHELLERLSSLSKTNVRDKLSAALRFLVACHSAENKDGWYRVSFPVSHQLLGDMAGITRESASTAMKELQKEKVVRNPKMTVLEINPENLNKVTEGSRQTEETVV